MLCLDLNSSEFDEPDWVKVDGVEMDEVAQPTRHAASFEAARILSEQGVSAAVVDLRSVSPLDKGTVCEAVARTGRMVVVDEDYEGFGLSGELAAVVLEAGTSIQFARVCTQTTIPYARHLEDQALPGVERILASVRRLLKPGPESSSRQD